MNARTPSVATEPASVSLPTPASPSIESFHNLIVAAESRCSELMTFEYGPSVSEDDKRKIAMKLQRTLRTWPAIMEERLRLAAACLQPRFPLRDAAAAVASRFGCFPPHLRSPA